MIETKFLEGKVVKRSLPVFRQPPPGDAFGPKRLLLDKGELANFYDQEDGIRYLAMVELRPGGIRGNHLHRAKEEEVYVISGEVVLVAQDGKSGARVSVNLAAGDLVSIATGVAHALRPTQAGYAVEFSRVRFDPADSEPFALI